MPRWKSVTVAAGAALALIACGNPTGGAQSSPAAGQGAADLRARLDYLLGEHLILASKATGAALGGRADDFTAYGSLLNRNGTDLGDLIGAAFGSAASNKFNQVWSAHDAYFVDYTTAVAKQDQAGQSRAVQDLTTEYVPEFADLISGATGLPKDSVMDLTRQHVLETRQVVDDQAKRDWPAVYTDVRKAYAHMQTIGDALAPAIVKKQPGKFPGSATGNGVDLRVALDLLLQEHLYLATDATSAALGDRVDEYQAAARALNDNGADLGNAFGSLFGTDTQDQFNQAWSAHNGYFVDYTTGAAKKDRAAQDRAVADLTDTYVPQLSSLLATATGLSKDTLTGLVKQHVLTTKDVVDAQAAKDPVSAAQRDRTAGQHMQMIGDPLAGAIVKRLPARFA